MKRAALIFLVLASVAGTAPAGYSPRLDAMEDVRQSMIVRKGEMEVQLGDTLKKFDASSDGWQKLLKDERAKHVSEVAGVKKQLERYEKNLWVKAALWCQRLFWTLVIGGSLLYIAAIVLGFGNPLGMSYKLSQMLVRALPLANFVRIFHRPTVSVPVTAAITPGIVTTGPKL